MARTAIGFFVVAFVLAACGPSAGDGDDDDDDVVGEVDAPEGFDASDTDAFDSDARTAYPDAPPFDGNSNCTDWMCQTPIPDGCMVGTSDVCGDGLDNNCNEQVDEGCTCSAGAVQQCFVGPPGHRNQGACVDGMQTCQEGGEFDSWGPCTGGIRPDSEACDSVDNDCNGCADDHPTCCTVELACPSTMPDGDPFAPYVINGTMFYGGNVTSWAWTVTGGPCDQLLAQTAGTTTFTLSGQNTSTLTFTPSLSGDYTITVVITAADGTVYTCTFIVHIRGPGLRVEMCSNRTGDTDIDTHLHRPNTNSSGWFSAAGGNDCNWLNCKGSSTTPPNWGYANSVVTECNGGPEGASWTALGYCRNPRLDIDSIRDEGVPENINVDVPQNGAAYRVMLNYFSGTGAAQPMVNIYCGGYLKATYGQAPDTVPGFDESGGDTDGDMWRVADVTPVVVGGVTTDCTVTQLHAPGMTSGYWVDTTPRTY